MTKRAVIYIRTAPNQQDQERIFAHQEQQTKAYCQAFEYEIVQTYADLSKFAHDVRPQFNQMLADADAGKFDVIVVLHEDRLYRGICQDMLKVADMVRGGKIKVDVCMDEYE